MADVITRFKVESSEYEKKIKSAKGSLNDFEKGVGSLTNALGINIKSLTALGSTVGVVTGALKVAKDAFFANEEQLDEWGRVTESAHSIYKGFLDSLNTGDISGFLTRIGQITQAARDAYDALDALGTYNAFNQINVEKTRTNLTESMAQYREGKGSKTDVQKSAAAYKKELADRQKMEQQAYIAAVNKVAKEKGISGKALYNALSGSYGNYNNLKNVQATGKKTTWVSTGFGGQGYSTTQTYAKNATEKMGEALRALNDTELNSLQALGAQAQRTGTEIAQVDKQTSRILKGSTTGGTTTSKGGGHTNANTPPPAAEGSIDWYQAEISKLNKELSAATDEDVRVNVQKMIDEYSKAVDLIKDKTTNYQWAERKASFKNTDAYKNNNGVNVGGESVADLGSIINGKDVQLSEGVTSGISQDIINQLVEGGHKARAAWMEASNAVGSVGQALQQIDNPAAKVFGIIAEAVANVAAGFAQALANSKTGKLSTWAWIAEAAAGTATMISTIAAIKSATAGSYAEGGIIGGTSFSGDRLQANVNSGELILNRSQQGNLAAQLQGTGVGAMHLETTVHGSDLRIMLNNESRRKGRGEYVMSK